MKTNEQYRVLQREVDELKAQNNHLISSSNLYIADQPLGRARWISELRKTPAQCLPQVKHDAIMTMQAELVKQISSECRCGALDDVDNFIYEYSQELITQEKDA